MASGGTLLMMITVLLTIFDLFASHNVLTSSMEYLLACMNPPSFSRNSNHSTYTADFTILNSPNTHRSIHHSFHTSELIVVRLAPSRTSSELHGTRRTEARVFFKVLMLNFAGNYR